MRIPKNKVFAGHLEGKFPSDEDEYYSQQKVKKEVKTLSNLTTSGAQRNRTDKADNLREVARDADNQLSADLCKHLDYCSIKLFNIEKCKTKIGMKNCQTYKYYNRYPNWREMFI